MVKVVDAEGANVLKKNRLIDWYPEYHGDPYTITYTGKEKLVETCWSDTILLLSDGRLLEFHASPGPGYWKRVLTIANRKYSLNLTADDFPGSIPYLIKI